MHSIHLYGNQVYGGSVAMRTGGGNDTVQVNYCVLGSDLFAQLQDNDDTLTLVGNQVAGNASFDGGVGTNRLNLIGNHFGTLSAVSFI